MLKIYTLLFCLHIFCSTHAQQIKLLKSTISPGGVSMKQSGHYLLSHTIGQPSLVNGFSSSSTLLLQGFQHPFLYDQMIGIQSGNKFTVFPNPSTGKISILWSGEAV